MTVVRAGPSLGSAASGRSAPASRTAVAASHARCRARPGADQMSPAFPVPY